MKNKFGNRVRKYRKNKGWTIYDLADCIGVTPSYISRIESRGEIPSPRICCLIAIFFGEPNREWLLLAVNVLCQQSCERIREKYMEECDDGIN